MKSFISKMLFKLHYKLFTNFVTPSMLFKSKPSVSLNVSICIKEKKYFDILANGTHSCKDNKIIKNGMSV